MKKIFEIGDHVKFLENLARFEECQAEDLKFEGVVTQIIDVYERSNPVMYLTTASDTYFPATFFEDEVYEEIQIKLHNEFLIPPEEISVGDMIDLRAAETVHLKKGEFRYISLGISMKLPEGFEAHVYPRSSTFKNFHLIQTNSTGIIDNSYCGDDDVWCFPCYAVEDTTIHMNDRICQFRIEKKQPRILFSVVDSLNNPNRGGLGSTGVQ